MVLARINEFDFKRKYVKGNKNRVVDALRRILQVNHIEVMSFYGTDL